MPGTLPSDFDSEWYAANYRDVALTGLSPQQHYLRFGRLLGRSVSAPAAPAVSGPAKSMVAGAEQGGLPAPTGVSPRQSREDMAFPIIDRPEGLDSVEAVPRAAPPRPGSNAHSIIALEEIAVGLAAKQAALGAALHAYARLLSIPMTGNANPRVSCEAAAFQTGLARIDNAWLSDDATLSLMFAGGAAPRDALSIRAYQAEPGSPGNLQMLGEGIELPPVGPVFHHVELLHPLMPVLLELVGADGTTRAIALMPFPSLLPGGLHAVELRALQNEPNPIDAFWSLSEVLLQETVGRESWADRSITAVAVDGGDGLPEPVRDWVSAVFGLSAGGDKPVGLRLQLPPDSVPTIGALASRRLIGGGQAFAAGPYLVAEAGSFRPRWSIALPADQLPGAAVPQLRTVAATGKAERATMLAPIHLGIVLRSLHGPSVPTADPPTDSPTMPIPANVSVVLSGSDAERLETVVQSIRAAVSGEIEFLLRTPDPTDEMIAALERACDDQGWRALPAGAGLPEIARESRHHLILTISDRIGLDGRTLPALLELLERDESAASASCALLSEKIIKKQAVLQPASGGLFPTGVSFASAPRLSFGEPDALQALPDLAYPVVANTLMVTLWRAGALAALPDACGPIRAAAEDIRLGLDLMRAGYRNWCTTQVSARFSGTYAPRDLIDPVGAAYLQPARWEDILCRVAVIRQLF